MITALALAVSLVPPTCSITDESRDMQLSVTRALRALRRAGCDTSQHREIHIETKLDPNGVRYYVATVTVRGTPRM